MALRPALRGLALCAGVGGLELGIELAVPAYRTVCFVEREAYAAAVLVARMDAGLVAPAPIWDDLTTFDGRRWRGRVDLVSAGFPCQPWSAAGAGKGTDDERWIWPDIARIIGEVRPRYVFLENVPPLAVRGGLARVLASLAEMGFDAEWMPVSVADVGGSHKRERLFILAHRHGAGCGGEWRGGLLDGEWTAQRDDVDGCNAGVADADRIGRNEGQWSIEQAARVGESDRLCDCGHRESDHDFWPDWPCCRCSCINPVYVADTSGEGLQRREQPGEPSAPSGGTGDGGAAVAEFRLPLFPAPPGDLDGWRAVLAVRPDLAPAVYMEDTARDGEHRRERTHRWSGRGVPQTGDDRRGAVAVAITEEGEAQSAVRGMADELAYRADRLRAAGNGVCPLAAGYACRTLAARLGVTL